ncbi:MAG TPA: hypothetical protein VKB95_11215, partial [Chitinophagaceae bacterium]|nr:hypothetical protein [Chitinophagaceae bacterium]
MKNLIFAVCCVLSIAAQGQLKRTAICPAFAVDILSGKVNELPINSTVGQIKLKLPCFSSAEDESATAKCGGGVFYKDRDIYFYTNRDYIEIGPNFKGKLSIPLMGASRNGLFKWLGLPKIKDVTWDAYEMAYGMMILYFTKAGKIN